MENAGPTFAELAAAPEVYRGRAQFSAGLAVTAAGAISAGAIFGANRNLPVLADWLAFLAIIALLVTVTFLLLAAHRTSQADVKQSEIPAKLISLSKGIQKRIRIAGGFAIGATLLFLGLVATILFSDPPTQL